LAKKRRKKSATRCELAYPGKTPAAEIRGSVRAARLTEVERFGGAEPGARANTLIHGDNLGALKALLESNATPRVRLVYIDPPFSTRQEFRDRSNSTAYRDERTGAEFVEFIRMRLALIRDLLADDGSVFVHLDWKKAHYIKAVMDELFGEENFLNDIIWSYGGRGAKATSGQFSRNHDIILWYSRGAHVFNRAYAERRVPKGAGGFRLDREGRWFKTSPRGDYTDESIAALEKLGRIHRTRTGKVRIKYFLEEDGDFLVEEMPVGDVWDDIPDAMHMGPGEKTGYPTQKPEALLKRVIEAASNPGDTVLDAFAGAGTTLVAAEKLGREWIGMDSGELSISTIKKRLAGIAGTRDLEDPARPYSRDCSPYILVRAG